MLNYYKDNTYSIGNTPLVKLNKITNNPNSLILAKIEGRNPAFSVKCRVGANLIWDAEKKGILTAEKTIVEPTSGNTGIALAYASAARGYKLILTMPETMSIERRKILNALGAELILTPGSKGMKGAIDKAEEITQSDPEKHILLQQFKNPANPEIHEKTTGPEIWNDTEGKIDVLVAGVGTGGTISGISRYIKKSRGKQIISVAVEPANSPVISQTMNNQDLKPGPHKIQGIGAGFIPDNLDISLIDRVEAVTDEEAIEYSRKLGFQEGILAGISSGAAVAAAVRLGRLAEFADKMIVVVLPDLAERYLSTVLFENIPDN